MAGNFGFMEKSFLVACCTLSVIFACNSARAGDITLVSEGKAAGQIVTAAGSEQAAEAAAEIQKYVEKMSGAKLPIVEEGKEDGAKPAILVGHTAKAAKLGVKIPSGFDPAIRPDYGEEEGYVLKTVKNEVVVAGNEDGPYRGTFYSAYALLEKLGCRWFFPGEWGEVIPQLQTVTISALDIEKRPDFAIRDAGTLYEDNWKLKVGFSDPALNYPVSGDGFLGFLAPPDKYFEEHPEWYAMGKDKQRHRGSHPRHTMLCMSNEEMYREAVKNLKESFAGEKKRAEYAKDKGIGLSPPDGMPFCYCEKCLEASQNFRFPRYFPERMMSDEFTAFSARLARDFPDKWVAISAYSLRIMPPQGVDVPQNMAVNVFPISTCVLHAGDNPGCWRRQDTLKIIKQWREHTPHVVVQHYAPGLLSIYGAGQRALLPERDVELMAAEAPILKEMDVKGVTGAAWVNGAKSFMATWLGYYMRGKLTWDANADVEMLKKDFYNKFFGPAAAPHVQAWWDACQLELSRSTAHAHEDWVAARHVYTVPFTKEIKMHVDAALKAEATARQRGRLEAFALIADHLEAYAAMNAAMRELDYAAAIAACERMVADVDKLNEIYPFFGQKNPTRKQAAFLRKIAARTNSESGAMVAALPLEMKFMRDPYNEGMLSKWYAPDFDDATWGNENTFLTWDQQDAPETARGHDYDGYGWYRAEIKVDKKWSGKPVKLYLGGVLNEGWVWVNGKYAGHQGHKLWWSRPHEFDVDITELVTPGKANQITIRVLNDAEIGGLYNRGFVWSPVK